MKCIKCESKNQQGNFCSNCGTKLKEKCPECGQMELIGRLVCETKLQKAEELKWNYITKKTKQMWRIFLYASLISLIIFLTIISTVLLAKSTLEVIAIILLCFLLIVFLFIRFIKIQELAEELAKKEFWHKYPEHAKIIKKAEGGKK